MVRNTFPLVLALLVLFVAAHGYRLHNIPPRHPPVGDATPPRPHGRWQPKEDVEFKYKWVALDGSVHDDQNQLHMLEVAGTLAITEQAHVRGADIVSKMVTHMPDATFRELAATASVGVFTFEDKTTIFPEYAHLADRPECEGTCAGACSDTCTADGRKYDDLAGLGGIRATCLDDNYMCWPDDPYNGATNILVHEFAHTIHQYGLPNTSDYWNKIYQAWYKAYMLGTWDRNSYAMSNHLEYFAEASGVFFNVNHLHGSSGGMSSCGKQWGYCETEAEARAWLKLKDPGLYDALSFTYTNNNPSIPGNISKCP